MNRTLPLAAAILLSGLAQASAQVGEMGPGAAAQQDEALAPIGIDASEAVLVAATGFVPSASAGASQTGYAARSVSDRSGGGYGRESGPSAAGEQPSAGTTSSKRTSSVKAQPSSGKTTSTASQTNGQLSDEVLTKAFAVAADINKSGGYRFDGYNDCYGFDRRVWDPILSAMGRSKLPVSDYPSSHWARITDWRKLLPGDVLATAQGHAWGAHWHGGLFKGMKNGTPMVFDNSSSHHGATIHSNEVFTYYYVPTHQMLAGD